MATVQKWDYGNLCTGCNAIGSHNSYYAALLAVILLLGSNYIATLVLASQPPILPYSDRFYIPNVINHNIILVDEKDRIVEEKMIPIYEPQ